MLKARCRTARMSRRIHTAVVVKLDTMPASDNKLLAGLSVAVENIGSSASDKGHGETVDVTAGN